MKIQDYFKYLGLGATCQFLPPFLAFLISLGFLLYLFFKANLDHKLDWKKQEDRMKKWEIGANADSKRKRKAPS
jgi:hypothetical protein